MEIPEEERPILQKVYFKVFQADGSPLEIQGSVNVTVKFGRACVVIEVFSS